MSRDIAALVDGECCWPCYAQPINPGWTHSRAVDLGGPKFEIKHKSRCIQKLTLLIGGAWPARFQTVRTLCYIAYPKLINFTSFLGDFLPLVGDQPQTKTTSEKAYITSNPQLSQRLK